MIDKCTMYFKNSKRIFKLYYENILQLQMCFSHKGAALP